MSELRNDTLDTQASQVRKTNQEMCGLLSKALRGIDRREVKLFVTSIQLSLITNSAIISALQDELDRVYGELEFRRSLDDLDG